MNNYLRKKLGLPVEDHLSDIRNLETKFSENTPITLDKSVKDSTDSQINIKTINVGTLRKPNEKLTIYNETNKSYSLVETFQPKIVGNLFYSNKDYFIFLNGEVLNYYTNLNIDQNNPYDPLFSSFNRLPSRASSITVQSGVTGLFLGDRERFFALNNGFNKSQSFEFKNAQIEINGIFTPTDTILNGKKRYLNSTIPFPADIIWSNNPSGWVLRRSTIIGNTSPRATVQNLYFNSNTIPTGVWQLTGSGFGSAPTSKQLDFEGFFKIATTTQSYYKNKVYARSIISGGNQVLSGVGSTTGTLPIGASWVTYPHSYNIENFPAFRYDTALAFSKIDKISDIIVVSTGISNKKIVYVSPHQIENFDGFWSDLVPSNRQSITGNNGQTINRNIYTLKSGSLLSVTSSSYNFTGLGTYTMYVSGFSGLNKLFNFDQSILKQTVPLNQTNFYKLYEPVYPKNAFNTGTWNGIIPSGTPFSIETLRTKNSEIISPLITCHVLNSFTNIFPSGSGMFQSMITPKGKNFMGCGFFHGKKTVFSKNSIYEANYIAEKAAKKQARSKLFGYLWDIGFLKGNSKVKKITKLLGSKETIRYCLNYINPNDPLSCSYTGINKGVLNGVLTSAGIRLPDNTLVPNKQIHGQNIPWSGIKI